MGFNSGFKGLSDAYLCSPSWESKHFHSQSRISPALDRTRKFIPTFTTARHSSLSYAHVITAFYLKINFNVILSIPWSSKWSVSFSFPNQNATCASLLPHACYMPSHLILLDLTIFVRLPARWHGTIRLTLDGFSWHLSIFRKSVQKIQVSLTL